MIYVGGIHMTTLIEKLKARRSFREFDKSSFDIQILIDAIEATKYSPSGANKQPWSFCIVQNPEIKKEIRIQSERIEKNFHEDISKPWKSDLEVLSVNHEKPFLEQAPYLIVIFKQTYQYDNDGNKTPVYYPDISTGIATGVLISVLTDFGIDILTYTPAPNQFLKEILKRPENEKPFLILVCGKGSTQYKLPRISKKSNEEIIHIY